MYKYLANLVDICVIYYIFYRLILLIKGSRAMQLVWGVGVLVLITAFAKFFDLITTLWLMEQVWLAGVFLLIVVFQPEIRSLLANIGSNPLGKILFSQEYGFIPELMEAVTVASKHKVGMLIVLEQDVGLMEYVDKGVRIDGVVSKELLLTIFFDKTMLHDGAVVIANNRIVSAASVLPLTEQQELSKIFGTRHRAALGLSEITDAIIIVVSEETGDVSLARSGRLQRMYDLKMLSSMLTDLYKDRAERTLLRKPKIATKASGLNGASNLESDKERRV